MYKTGITNSVYICTAIQTLLSRTLLAFFCLFVCFWEKSPKAWENEGTETAGFNAVWHWSFKVKCCACYLFILCSCIFGCLQSLTVMVPPCCKKKSLKKCIKMHFKWKKQIDRFALNDWTVLKSTRVINFHGRATNSLFTLTKVLGPYC